jgi:hypothetical protein
LPTATQWAVSAHEMPFRLFVTPELSPAHVAPPSSVATIVPFAPTAQHVEASPHDVPVSVTVVGFCIDQVPAAPADAGSTRQTSTSAALAKRTRRRDGPETGMTTRPHTGDIPTWSARSATA